MLIKLTSGELKEMLTYQAGPIGDLGFLPFMTALCARINEESGELDIDRDDREEIELHSRSGHKAELDRIFGRPINDALKRFTG